MDDPRSCDLREIDPPVVLPDGTSFRTWEAQRHWERTFHVAAEHPDADDDNDGSEATPWRTIQRAAEGLEVSLDPRQPGQAG